MELKIVVWKGNRMFSDYNLLTMEIGGGGGQGDVGTSICVGDCAFGL